MTKNRPLVVTCADVLASGNSCSNEYSTFNELILVYRLRDQFPSLFIRETH